MSTTFIENIRIYLILYLIKNDYYISAQRTRVSLHLIFFSNLENYNTRYKNNQPTTTNRREHKTTPKEKYRSLSFVRHKTQQRPYHLLPLHRPYRIATITTTTHNRRLAGSYPLPTREVKDDHAKVDRSFGARGRSAGYLRQERSDLLPNHRRTRVRDLRFFRRFHT